MGGTSTPTGGHSCPDMAARTGAGRAGQGKGSSPNSSWIRRRSRIRGSVSPPTQRHPEARFAAGRFAPAGDDGGTLEGTFTLNGVERPLRMQVSQVGQNRYRATGSVVQSSYGIKPYTGFFGALKVRDAVDFEVEADVRAQDGLG